MSEVILVKSVNVIHFYKRGKFHCKLMDQEMHCYGTGMGEVRETWAKLHPFVTVLPYHIETFLQHNRQHYYYLKSNNNESNRKHFQPYILD
jgi:hypothetical protein